MCRMRKVLFILFFAGIFSCSSKNDNVSKESNNTPGIQNVNEKIPDTTRANNADENKTDSSTYHPNTPD